jgi:hypothetical protein
MFRFEAAGTMRWREDLEVTTASCFEETRSWVDESSVHLVSVIATSDRQVRVRSTCYQSALPTSMYSNWQIRSVGSDLARELLSSSTGFVVDWAEGMTCDSLLVCPKAVLLLPQRLFEVGLWPKPPLLSAPNRKDNAYQIMGGLGKDVSGAV